MNVIEMDQTQAMELLSSQSFGRLACSKDEQPYVVPISFALDGKYLYSFSLNGQKIDWMRANPSVCLLVENLSRADDWSSVVVYGRYEELPDQIGMKHIRERAWSLLSRKANWWEPGSLKPATQALTPHLFYRIAIESLTGRRAVPE